MSAEAIKYADYVRGLARPSLENEAINCKSVVAEMSFQHAEAGCSPEGMRRFYIAMADLIEGEGFQRGMTPDEVAEAMMNDPELPTGESE